MEHRDSERLQGIMDDYLSWGAHCEELSEAGWEDSTLDGYRQQLIRQNDDGATVRPGRR